MLPDISSEKARAEFIAKIESAFIETKSKCEDMGIMFDNPNWKPLEDLLPHEKCSDFMWMGGHIGGIQMYKNINTRRYLNVDRNGQCFIYDSLNNRYGAVSRDEAIEHAYS